MLTSRNSDKHWEEYGKVDPYFGVLSADRYRLPNLMGASRDEFFESGRQHIEQVLRTIRAHLFADFRPTRVLDFGCGVGRTTIPLSGVAAEVIGIDVSDSMLKEAKRNAELNGARNIVFAKDVRQCFTEGQVDFIHSFIVFQHIPVAKGEALFRDLLDGLSAGGVGAVHFTYHASAVTRAGHWVLRNVPLACNLYNILVGRRPTYPIMQSNFYSVNRLLLVLQQKQCHDIYMQFTLHKRNHGVMIYFRKA